MDGDPTDLDQASCEARKGTQQESLDRLTHPYVSIRCSRHKYHTMGRQDNLFFRAIHDYPCGLDVPACKLAFSLLTLVRE
jgi:hypothetical protein